ncbi:MULTISPECIES: hypothetical protein [unclassified Streptomyces]|uniref:hypothetical protein n=1 Tax=unclassified Streptomyces TaxID=2593676 RepID=UPI000BD3455C|nr:MULTISPECIES: hypothetical protein [unclassified Streptomyces]SOD46820.1 hypothetical protein SAMN06272727_4210 [Streptomyces sp. Ag82_G6-1]
MNADPPLPIAQRLRGVNRPLVAALTAVALVRPLFSITGWSEALGKPLTPVILTLAITMTWILAVGLSRVRDPLLTLVVTGVAYALAALILSAALSPLLTGKLQGPLAQPQAIVPLFLVNAAWGAFCGACAMGLRRVRVIRR